LVLPVYCPTDDPHVHKMPVFAVNAESRSYQMPRKNPRQAPDRMHGQALNAVRLPFSPPEGERMPRETGR